MAQINTCLKRTFTVFNVLLAVLGAVIILLTCLVQVHASEHGGDKVGALVGFIFFYILGAGTLILASLGAFGAHRENKGVLIGFLVCVLLGTLVTLRSGVNTISLRPVILEALEDDLHQLLPLNQAPQEVKAWVEAEQSDMHCCGLFGRSDWQDELPDSCLCSPEEAQEEEGLCQDVSRQLVFKTETKLVYAKPCLPYIMYYFTIGVDVVCGLTLTLAVLGILAIILSSIMIHQLRRPNAPTIIMTVPAIFTSPPPKYQELQNPPGY